MRTSFVPAALLCAAVLPVAAEMPDPLEMVLRGLELGRRSDQLAKEYSMTQESIRRQLGPNGEVRSVESKTYEIIPLYGEPYQKLIRENGQPLSDSDARKVERKFEDAAQERASETPRQRARRLAKYDEQISRRREMLDEFPKAFNFRVLREEEIDGHAAWLIEAKPKPGYKPRSMRTSFLPKMEGRFWMAKHDHRLLKVDAVTTDTVSFGMGLAKMGPGTRITVEQIRITDDLWLTKRFRIRYDGKIAFFKTFRGENEQINWDFRREEVTSARRD